MSNSDKAIPGLTVVVVIYEHGSADSIDGTSYKGNPNKSVEYTGTKNID